MEIAASGHTGLNYDKSIWETGGCWSSPVCCLNVALTAHILDFACRQIWCSPTMVKKILGLGKNFEVSRVWTLSHNSRLKRNVTQGQEAFSTHSIEEISGSRLVLLQRSEPKQVYFGVRKDGEPWFSICCSWSSSWRCGTKKYVQILMKWV